MNLFLAALSVVAITALSVPAAYSQSATVLKDRYKVIGVEQFDVAPGVNFPSERLAALREGVIKRLKESKKAGEITGVDEATAKSSGPVLKLSGTIQKFQPGSQAERYFVGFGAGTTDVYARISLSDMASGRVFLTEDVHGMVQYGLEPSSDVDGAIARRIAVATQLMLEAELTAGDESSVAQGPPLPPEQYSLSLDSHDMAQAEKRVNAEAALGYRVVGADLTGKHAALLTFEKPATSSGIYEYRIFHIMLEGTMKKELKEASEEGFCFTPQTLMPGFGGFVSWVMDRPDGVRAARCVYREHAPVRVSTTQHQIMEDEKDGFHMAATTDIPGDHVVLMEKRLDAGVRP